MRLRSINLMVLLAFAVAVAPLHAAVISHHARASGPVHVHEHEHVHGGTSHASPHHHHPGDTRSSDDHHCVLDHCLTPKIHWTAPRRVVADAPPVSPRAAVVTLAPMVARLPLRRAKPPPWSGADTQHLTKLRTVILRL